MLEHKEIGKKYNKITTKNNIMTLEEVAIHHRINPNSLNTKDDALKIGIKSIKELIPIMEKRGVGKNTINDIKRLGLFFQDVINTSS